MQAQYPEYKCEVCGKDGIKSWWVEIEGDDKEWHRWCDSCIADRVDNLIQVCVHPKDFLKIPPLDPQHPFHAPALIET